MSTQTCENPISPSPPNPQLLLGIVSSKTISFPGTSNSNINYDIKVQQNGSNNIIQGFILQLNQFNYAFQYVYDPQTGIYTVTTNNVPGVSVANSLPNPNSTTNDFDIVVTTAERTYRYKFEFFKPPPDEFQTGFNVTLCQGALSSVQVPSSPNGELPNISGPAELTKDGENICQVTYIVSEVPNCKENIISKETTYRIYGPDIASVMVGKGCTLLDKIDYISSKGFNIDFYTMIAYSTLRLILSKLLYGDFDVKYLQRSYYKQFLKDLRNSVWKAYVEYFRDPMYGVRDYWTFFRE